MRHPRIFEPNDLVVGTDLELSPDGAGHVGRVLRMNAGDSLTLFNGHGGQYEATITQASKKNVIVHINEFQDINSESPLTIHLGQAISRGDKMDFTIQKSVELGVTTITPLFTERCGVKLSGERLDKKIQQWQKIVISACEQCGRNFVPKVLPPQQLKDWAAEETEELKLNLHPRATYSINTLPEPKHGVRLLIGPEGGLSADEISMTEQFNFEETLLGPRVLRTETAALTAITALQCRFGDLG